MSPAEATAAPRRLVIGEEPWLSWAADGWRRATPAIAVTVQAIVFDPSHGFDAAAVPAPRDDGALAFAAWGPGLSGYPRLGLYGLLKSLGYRLPALVDPQALVAPDVQPAENAFIAPGAVIAAGCTIGSGVHVGIGSTLGPGVHVGRNAWIGDGVVIGAAAQVGAHGRLETGVIVPAGARLGRHVIRELPGRTPDVLPDDGFELRPRIAGVAGMHGVIVDLARRRR